jgi:hypothetical protein
LLASASHSRIACSASSAARSGEPLAAAKLSKSSMVDGVIDRLSIGNMLKSSSENL